MDRGSAHPRGRYSAPDRWPIIPRPIRERRRCGPAVITRNAIAGRVDPARHAAFFAGCLCSSLSRRVRRRSTHVSAHVAGSVAAANIALAASRVTDRSPSSAYRCQARYSVQQVPIAEVAPFTVAAALARQPIYPVLTEEYATTIARMDREALRCRMSPASGSQRTSSSAPSFTRSVSDHPGVLDSGRRPPRVQREHRRRH